MTDLVPEGTPEEETELVIAGEFPMWNPDNDFRKLALDTYYISQGFRLIDKEDLIGVPFVVKRVVYREGMPRSGAEGDYVSVECIVADKLTLSAAPVRAALPDPLEVYAQEPVIFNDSSTGIRRTLTKLFDDAKLIDVGQAMADANEYDKPFQAWHSGAGPAQAGFTGDDVGVRGGVYLAMRGLRRSDYEFAGGQASTFYFG